MSIMQTPTGLRIGFVSTRFAGTDGVSLETAKWAHVLKALGHECFYFSGESDLPPEISRVVPEAFFGHPAIAAVQVEAFGQTRRSTALTDRIRELSRYLEEQLYAFVRDFRIDLLIVQNALAIPMNIPLGAALTEFIVETEFPTIAHHHDFFWERKRFLTGCVWDYLNMCFPPQLTSMRHVVINTSGRHQLGLRTGVSSILVPNVMEFEQPPAPHDDYVATLRQDLGVEPGEYLVLQPTRIVQRKGIEHAIELIHRLDLLGLRCRMIISHAGGDEGDSYVQRVRNFAALMDVRLNIVADQIAPRRGTTLDGRKIYTLDDVYGQADLVTYPSTFEGFGNAFLEAVYFKRPVVVNSYSIFATDIKPKGFQVIEFDGYITDDTVREVRDLFENPVRVAAMGEHNYALARRYYSYSVLQRQLEYLLVDLFGVEHAGPGATGDAHATTAAAEAAHARAANKQAQSG